jgi:hypothetical protein
MRTVGYAPSQQARRQHGREEVEMSGDKAGPREDEQRKHEDGPLVGGTPVEGRTDPHLFQDSQDLEPGRRPLTGEQVGNAPSIDEVNRKSDFARWLRPSELPTDARTLARTAADEGAPDWVRASREPLDPDRRFDTNGEAWEAAARSG